MAKANTNRDDMRLKTPPPRRTRGDGYQVRAVLLAALSVDGADDELAALLEALGDADLLTLTSLAEVHGVAEVVHDRLRCHANRIPADVLSRLKAHRLAAAARQLQSYQVLADVASVLDVPFLTMKGPVLAADWYGDASLRGYVDIDLLVARGDFSHALDTLIDAGFEYLAINWQGFLYHGVAEIPLGRKGSMIDLHWHPIALARARRSIDLDVTAMIGRSRRVRLGVVDVRAHAPEDTLLHLCVNSGLDGARRLRRLVDVDVVARSGRVAWEVFVERARGSSAEGLCAAVLQRAALLIGTPLPHGLLPELAPFPGWLAANALIDRRRRTGRRLAHGVASGLLLASGRSTRWMTAATLARQTIEATLVRVGRPPATAPGGVLDWQRAPVDGDIAAWRRRYLAWVSSADDKRRAAVSRGVGPQTTT